MSVLEDKLLAQIIEAGLPEPQLEVRFHPTRKWRFDMYWPVDLFSGKGVACECEGGTYSGGRHVRGRGYENDCYKYNEAALMGITVLRVTAKHITDGSAIEWLRRALWTRDSEAAMRPLDGHCEK